MGTSNRSVIFLCIYISYLLNVYVRRSVTYAIPALASQESIDKGQLGIKDLLCFSLIWGKAYSNKGDYLADSQ